MSKNRNNHQHESHSHQGMSHAEEYRIIRMDLLRVVVLNAIYLGGMLALYYTNNQHHYLERWFEKIFHF